MIINLTGKNALVCGASKGIGKATAIQLAKSGANVFVLSRNAGRLVEVISQMDTTRGQSHKLVCADMSDTATLEKNVKDVLKSDIVHILVNNTGGPAPSTLSIAEKENFLSAFNQHLIANHTLANLVIPGMKKAHYGRIINVISTSVKIPLKGLGVSNTIRGAVASWSKTLANELGPFGITVNNILPGATATERLEEIIQTKSSKQMASPENIIEEMQDEIPMGRFAKPEEIAAGITFLASAEAAYITGINLPIDGGRTGCL